MLKWLLIFPLFISPVWPLGQHAVPGEPYLIINKQTNEMAFIDDGAIQSIYRVASGSTAALTPEGEFSIVVKAVDPYYRKKNIPGGDPENPLGPRWIGFDAQGTDGRTYGIHGTNRESSIGGFVTQGCVRMHNEEVIELYSKVPVGTKVWITVSSQSFETLAREKGAVLQTPAKSNGFLYNN
ncbi:L,D-transpeptidase [Metabacillus mangrovi]|uniref:L,D-transpeptidase n=1 Tax=Metabacillus mangrovi TaxID=1491830 RepID=UPI003D32395B